MRSRIMPLAAVLVAGCAKSSDIDTDARLDTPGDTAWDMDAAADPGTDVFGDPATDPVSDLAPDPAVDSAPDSIDVVAEDPGTDPGYDPGFDPGTDPGFDPGTDPGTDPGYDYGYDYGADGCTLIICSPHPPSDCSTVWPMNCCAPDLRSVFECSGPTGFIGVGLCRGAGCGPDPTTCKMTCL
jgi:hypothetical protein